MDETRPADGDAPAVAARLHRPHRLNTLADGVFAIAMTLLALEIRVPEEVPSGEAFRDQLPELFVGIGVFALAFFITGQYWMGQHRVMSFVHTVDARALPRCIVALIGVASLPIAMSLIINDGGYPEAVAITATLLALTSLLSARFYAHVLQPEFADIDVSTRRRYVTQAVYNGVVYLLSVPLAFGLAVAGIVPAYAAFGWLLLWFTVPVSAALVRRFSGSEVSAAPR